MTWFTNWFGTKYYKLLYRHRDEAEAHAFLDRLIARVELPKGAKIIDVGSGQGRHSRYLASKGFVVTGLDIDEENIRAATKAEHERLHFIKHDMREPFPVHGADLVLNVFTSFGYFENDEENQAAITNMAAALKKDGLLVIDFLNAEQVKTELDTYTEISRSNVDFCIHKEIKNGFVVKTIDISDKGEKHMYQEKVRLLTLQDFERYFECCRLNVQNVFGTYSLEPFDARKSPRLLLTVKKEGK